MIVMPLLMLHSRLLCRISVQSVATSVMAIFRRALLLMVLMVPLKMATVFSAIQYMPVTMRGYSRIMHNNSALNAIHSPRLARMLSARQVAAAMKWHQGETALLVTVLTWPLPVKNTCCQAIRIDFA